MKRISLAAILLLLVLGLSTPISAAEPGSGTIEGSVTNGTVGGSGVGDLDIALQTYLYNTQVESPTAKTDTQGHFVFEGLATDQGYLYQVTLNFQQADYSSDWLSFDDGETKKAADITVYDSTTSANAIKISVAHTVIYLEENSLKILEYFLFVNDSDRTYIGSAEIPSTGKTATLEFSLPEGATELEAKEGLMQCCVFGIEDGFVDTMPFFPGAKEVVYSYKVGRDPAYIFARNIDYPTDNYDLLIEEKKDGQVTSDQLAVKEALDIEGTRFNHLSGTDLATGDTITVQVSSLLAPDNQATIRWIVLAGSVLFGSFSLSRLLRRAKTKSSPEGLSDESRTIG